MAKLIKASIDVTKIKKEHIFKSEKGGQYVNVEIWINDELDQYGNDCAVKQSYKVGDGYESHYIGNGKKGFGWDETSEQKPVQAEEIANPTEDDDLPF